MSINILAGCRRVFGVLLLEIITDESVLCYLEWSEHSSYALTISKAVNFVPRYQPLFSPDRCRDGSDIDHVADHIRSRVQAPVGSEIGTSG